MQGKAYDKPVSEKIHVKLKKDLPVCDLHVQWVEHTKTLHQLQ